MTMQARLVCSYQKEQEVVASARIWPKGRKWFACVPPRRKGAATGAAGAAEADLGSFGLHCVPLHPFLLLDFSHGTHFTLGMQNARLIQCKMQNARQTRTQPENRRGNEGGSSTLAKKMY